VVNAWDDPRVREAVERTGRKQVLIAAHALCVCAMLPAFAALADGFDPYVIVDACGPIHTNLSVLLTEIIRVAQAGVRVVNSAPVLTEMMGGSFGPLGPRDFVGVRSKREERYAVSSAQSPVHSGRVSTPT
jgi:hypothetical protein